MGRRRLTAGGNGGPTCVPRRPRPPGAPAPQTPTPGATPPPLAESNFLLVTDMPDEPRTETLSRDAPCIHCGYNLRGLSEHGLCPECGHAIAESLHGDLLCYSSPKWLRSVRFGVFLAFLVSFLTVFLRLGSDWIGELHRTMPGVLLVLRLSIQITALASAILMTVGEPRNASKLTPGISIRTVVRYLAFATFLVFVIIQFLSQEQGFPWKAIWPFTIFLYIATFVVELLLLRTFAKRVPDARLCLITTLVLWLGTLGELIHGTNYMLLVYNVGAGNRGLGYVFFALLDLAAVWLAGIVPTARGMLHALYVFTLGRQIKL